MLFIENFRIHQIKNKLDIFVDPEVTKYIS